MRLTIPCSNKAVLFLLLPVNTFLLYWYVCLFLCESEMLLLSLIKIGSNISTIGNPVTSLFAWFHEDRSVPVVENKMHLYIVEGV